MQKDVSKILFLAFFISAFSGRQLIASDVYRWNDHNFEIYADSPPALVFVTDSSGNMTGADPSKGLDNFGQGTAIQQIPSSFVEQDHLSSDSVNGTEVSDPKTSWSINITDQSKTTYTVNLKGISTGVFQLWATILYTPKLRIPMVRSKQEFFVTKGETKQLQVAFDPASRTLTATAIINSGDFLKDTQAACGLGSIGPPEACEALEALAVTAEKAKTKGDSRLEAETLEIYLSTLNRLHNWGQKGYRKDWDDFKDHTEGDHLRQKDLHETKFFAKDPAYSALKLDAETMLKGLPKVGGHGEDGHRDGDDHKDDHHDGDIKK